MKDTVRYLGLLIDSNLTWKSHVDYISLKISRLVGIIAKLRHYVPKYTLQKVYHGLMHPYLTYGISIWGQAHKTILNPLLVLQKRVIRLINYANYRDHVIPFFIDSKISPLNFLYFYNTACLMHDIINNNSPLNIADLFTEISDVHNYNTRSAARKNLYQPQTRLNISYKSFSSIGVKVCNNLSPSIRSLSKSLFKKKCTKHLLMESLLSCDDYVEVAFVERNNWYCFDILTFTFSINYVISTSTCLS